MTAFGVNRGCPRQGHVRGAVPPRRLARQPRRTAHRRIEGRAYVSKSPEDRCAAFGRMVPANSGIPEQERRPVPQTASSCARFTREEARRRRAPSSIQSVHAGVSLAQSKSVPYHTVAYHTVRMDPAAMRPPIIKFHREIPWEIRLLHISINRRPYIL